jgi:hypothetical protein
MAWIENGPVSLPSGGTRAIAALLIGVAALAGVGLGFSAGWRGGEQRVAGAIDPNQDIDQAPEAKPLVTLVEPTAPAASVAAANAIAAKKADDNGDDSNEIAAKTAAVQAVQSKPADDPKNIDDLLTSPSEKPQAPAKPTTDEQAPPAKTDVPF